MMSVLKRRSFIKSALATSAILPLSIRGLVPSAFAAETPKRRVIFFYVPDGVILGAGGSGNDRWHPSMVNGVLTMNDMSATLDAVKADMNFIKGMNYEPLNSLPTHEGGIKKFLGSHAANGTTIDTALGKHFSSDNLYGILRLGMATGYNDTQFMSTDNGVLQSFEDDPAKVYSGLFGTPLGADARIQKLSVIDTNLGDLNRLMTQLGSVEKVKLEAHVESLNDLRKRINTVSAGSCSYSFSQPIDHAQWQTPDGWDGYFPKEEHLTENLPIILDQQIDLAVGAFACDKTQVISIQISNPVSENFMTWVDSGAYSSTDYHGYSHYKAGAGYENSFVELRKWYMGKLAELITKLKNTDDVNGGSLLDNTLIMVGSDLGDSDNHDHNNIPLMTAGGANMGVTTGQLHELNAAPHTQLLQTVVDKVSQGAVSSSPWKAIDPQGRGALDLS
jgi:hypothetical protein